MKYFLFFLVASFIAGYYIERIPARVRSWVIPALIIFLVVAFFVFDKV